MTVTVRTVAAIAAAVYRFPTALPFSGMVELEVAGVFFALVPLGDVWVVLFRGSLTRKDWERDLISQNVDHDPILKSVPLGFNLGMADVFVKIAGVLPLGAKIIFGGHSLGAARAANAASRFELAHHRPLALVRWGTPRPGTAYMASVLDPVVQYTYRNGLDKVCDVPFDIPLVTPFEHTGPMVELHEAPFPTDQWGPFAEHHFQLYQAGCDKLPDVVLAA